MTLDADVQALLDRLMEERGISFKEALNTAVRASLSQPSSRSFVQQSFSLGSEQNFRWEKALSAASALEDEELGRKLALRK